MTEPFEPLPPALVPPPAPDGPPSTFSLHCGDAVESLRLLADASVDLIVFDPAYESLEKHRAKGTTTRLKQSKASSNQWFQIFRNERFPDLFAELYRVLRRDRHCYMYCDQETMFITKPMAEAAGFKFWKPLVWDKVTMGMGYHYRARYEFILFFEKGKRQLNDLGIDDILEAKRVRDAYPTEKPVETSATLITQSSQPGEIVLDMFMGSGSVGEAAIRNRRHFVGIDLAQGAVDLTRERLLGIGSTPSSQNIFASRAAQPGQRGLGLL